MKPIFLGGWGDKRVKRYILIFLAIVLVATGLFTYNLYEDNNSNSSIKGETVQKIDNNNEKLSETKTTQDETKPDTKLNQDESVQSPQSAYKDGLEQQQAVSGENAGNTTSNHPTTTNSNPTIPSAVTPTTITTTTVLLPPVTQTTRTTPPTTVKTCDTARAAYYKSIYDSELRAEANRYMSEYDNITATYPLGGMRNSALQSATNRYMSNCAVIKARYNLNLASINCPTI